MRQAGRSLPEYRRLREGVAMLDACMRPRPGRRDHAAAGTPLRRGRGHLLLRHRAAAQGGGRRPRHRARRRSGDRVAGHGPLADVEAIRRTSSPAPFAFITRGGARAGRRARRHPADRVRRCAVHAWRPTSSRAGRRRTRPGPRRSCSAHRTSGTRCCARSPTIVGDLPRGPGRGRRRSRAAVRLLGRRPHPTDYAGT